MNDYNEADEQFVRDMIAHHQMAIDMVDAYYANSKNREIQLWAIDIQTGQANEIEKRQLWLTDRGLSTVAKENNDDSTESEMGKKKKNHKMKMDSDRAEGALSKLPHIIAAHKQLYG